MSLRIGELARAADVPVSTIRYYERIGLLKPAGRSTGRYRLYKRVAADELLFIQRAQALGFTLPEIGGLLRLSRTGTAPCTEILRLAREHLAAVDTKIAQLTQFRAHLRDAVSAWSEGHCGFTVEGLCSLIDVGTLAVETGVITKVRGKARSQRRDA